MAKMLPLEIRDLAVAGNGRTILKLDTLDLAPGRSLGVRGPSGAGKTTLIFALAGLVPASGLISWGGANVAAMGAGAQRQFRAENLGLVFQDFLLFEELGPAANASILALFSPRRQRRRIRDRADSLLGRMGVPGRRTTTTLSGGERQRVAIARALAADPAVLLADEPTAALHREAADQVTADLVAHARDAGRTLVVASHDEHLLAKMDGVLELSGGTAAA